MEMELVPSIVGPPCCAGYGALSFRFVVQPLKEAEWSPQDELQSEPIALLQ